MSIDVGEVREETKVMSTSSAEELILILELGKVSEETKGDPRGNFSESGVYRYIV